MCNKVKRSATEPVVACFFEAGDRGGVVRTGVFGVDGGAALRREREPGVCLAEALSGRAEIAAERGQAERGPDVVEAPH